MVVSEIRAEWFSQRQGMYRSCIYVHSATITNRLEAGKDIFAVFVDIKKFDWVDRDLPFYKLLGNNVNGKVF